MPAQYGIHRKEARNLLYVVNEIDAKLKYINQRKKQKENWEQEVYELLQQRKACHQRLWDIDGRPLHKKLRDKNLARRREILKRTLVSPVKVKPYSRTEEILLKRKRRHCMSQVNHYYSLKQLSPRQKDAIAQNLMFCNVIEQKLHAIGAPMTTYFKRVCTRYDYDPPNKTYIN